VLPGVPFVFGVNIEVDFALLGNILRTALERGFDYSSVPFHFFKRSASGFIVTYGVGKSALAVFAVNAKVFKSWVILVVCFPAEGGASFLAVDWHARLSVVYAVFFVRVPAEHVVSAFVVSLAQFKLTTLQAALCLERPVCAKSAVKAIVAI